ncbi:MAG: choice-of-anchor V domain-containing protein [Candidatus Krumholzibacteriia bacterium]
MTRSNRHRVLRLLAAGALMLVAGQALAFSGGPPDGRTNAPGEGNCTACHSTFPLNSGSGMLDLAGLPANFSPGATYDLSLTLSDPDAMRWGFELTILEAGGASAGTIIVTEAGTQTSTTGNRTYLKHTSAGTAPGTGLSRTWNFQWTAPDAGTGDVALYVAGNAANNNGLNSGDRIYATFFGSMEDTGVPVFDTPLALTLHGATPNPFNPRTEIRFDLPRPASVRITVLTVDGRRVATLVDGAMTEGAHAVAWDGRDHSGVTMGSGTYLYVVEAGRERKLGRMTLLK